MKERPIIFNSEMVRAVMEGRKVQTRRIIVPSMRTADAQFELHQQPDGSWRPMHTFNEGSFDSKGCERPINCPFGAVGDRLWVRETWSDVNFEGVPAVAYRADGGVRPVAEDDGDDSDPKLEKYWFANWYPDLISGVEGNWRPSIHMPRWASRITLEITGVRVERLNNISQADAVAEGIKTGRCGNETSWRDAFYVPGDNQPYFNAETAYGDLWSSIYGEESWQANPWVWVIEFKRVEGQ